MQMRPTAFRGRRGRPGWYRACSAALVPNAGPEPAPRPSPGKFETHTMPSQLTVPPQEGTPDRRLGAAAAAAGPVRRSEAAPRSEEHTSELQSQSKLVCRLLLEKKKKTRHTIYCHP